MDEFEIWYKGKLMETSVIKVSENYLKVWWTSEYSFHNITRSLSRGLKFSLSSFSVPNFPPSLANPTFLFRSHSYSQIPLFEDDTVQHAVSEFNSMLNMRLHPAMVEFGKILGTLTRGWSNILLLFLFLSKWNSREFAMTLSISISS